MRIITLLRKPLDGTIAENLLRHRCGALNIKATRIETTDDGYFKNWDRHQSENQGIITEGWKPVDLREYAPTGGRWPANLVLVHRDGCGELLHKECACVTLDSMSADADPICVVNDEIPTSRLASHFFQQFQRGDSK